MYVNWLQRIAIIFPVLSYAETNYATSYYFSATNGNDSYTVSQARNQSTPWKSLQKLNSTYAIYKPGDSILLECNNIFYGNIVINFSGTNDEPIVISSYGTGNNPVISGLSKINNWVLASKNIWVSDLSSIGTTFSNLYINSKIQSKGRHPNDKSYFIISTHKGNNTLICDEDILLNMTGAEAVIRTNRWSLEKTYVASQVGNEYVFSNPVTLIRDKYGFFLQNHLNTLDQNGEWYTDKINNKLYLYDETDPNLQIITISNISDLIYSANQQHIKIENLYFNGSSGDNLRLINSDYITICNNVFSESGNIAVNINVSTNIKFYRNKVYCADNCGLVFDNSNDIHIYENEIRNVGSRPGYGHTYSYIGIYLNGANIYCHNNSVDSTGYHGIFFTGQNICITQNRVSNFCLVKDDGAAIYTSGDGVNNFKGLIVDGNIVSCGIGAPIGTDNSKYFPAEGIYIDSRSSDVVVRNNTIADCPNYGIFIQNSKSIDLLGNIVFNCSNSQLFMRHSSEFANYQIKDCNLRHNVFLSKNSNAYVAKFESIDNDIAQFGKLDSNYYCRPVKEDMSMHTLCISNGYNISKSLNLDEWKAFSIQDKNSRTSPINIHEYEISQTLSENKVLNSSFESGLENWRFWSKYNNAFFRTSVNQSDGSNCAEFGFSEASNSDDSRMFIAGRIGNIQNDMQYALKFSLVSSLQNKRLKIGIQEEFSPYSLLSYNLLLLATDRRKEYEVLFRADSSCENSILVFTIEENGAYYQIDDLNLTNVIATSIDLNAKIKLINNFTGLPKSPDLSEGYYIDHIGMKYSGILAPFSSKVLFNVTKEIYDTCLNPKKVTSITVLSKNGIYAINDFHGNLQLFADIKPFDADLKFVKWTIERITGDATLDTNGILTAIKDGTIRVIATAIDGSGITGSVIIKITGQDIPVYLNSRVSISNNNNYSFQLSNRTSLIFQSKNKIIKRIELLDLYGKILLSSVIQSSYGELNISKFPKGIYILRVTDQFENKKSIKICFP